MKTLLLFISFCFLISQANSQNKKKVEIQNSTDWMDFKKTAPTSALKFANKKAALLLGDADELQLKSTKKDKLNFEHYRYQQTYKGLPVEGAIYLMHEKNGRLQTTNGTLIHNLELEIKPVLNEKQALDKALKYVDANKYAWENETHKKLHKAIMNDECLTLFPTAELVIVDPEFGKTNKNYGLAYKFDIYAIEPLSRQIVYIDADTGNILTSIEKIHSCTNVSASGLTNYSGIQNFTACQSEDDYILKSNADVDIQVFSSNNTYSFPNINIVDDDTFFNNDPVANEVHWATGKVDEYFRSIYNRNSLDDNGMELYSWVHYGEDLNNAYWTGSYMLYGDGDGKRYSSLTSPDVIAHELTHGITEFDSGLLYRGESGALNESFSDIFGEVLERYMRGTNDWLIGGDFTIAPGKTCLRNMSKPKDPNALTQQPDTYGATEHFWKRITTDCHALNDYCGVHINSGVQNYWFYLLSEGGSGFNDKEQEYYVEGIGMDKAAEIAYRNLTVYMRPNYNYDSTMVYSIKAAKDLQEEEILTASDVEQVYNAWCAVGVANCSTPLPEPTTPITCNKQTDSLALVALYNATDGLNWTNPWDLSTPYHTWSGVAYDNGCVVSLFIKDKNNLNGTIPPELGNLNGLRELRLRSNNGLTNDNPPDTLNGGLRGSIPAELSNLTNLAFLDLRGNQLTGTIPPELGNLNELIEFSLAGNKLTGTIPVEVTNFPKLQFFGLDSNQLTGSIPPEIGNLTKLIKLNLARNNFTGSIPNEIGNLTNLRYLILHDNQLTGAIPSTIGNLLNLIQLKLQNNDLTGPLPAELGNLINLTWLELRWNNITGQIPPELGNLINLQHLYLTKNQLTGSTPVELGNLNNLTHLRLDDNELAGGIPSMLGNLINLKVLYLSRNQLDGCFDENLLNICNQLELKNIDSSNNFDALWEDFCLNGSGACTTVSVASVYPGDFNNDGIVDIKDLLAWGVAEGATGAIRPNASLQWTPQECQDWLNSLYTTISKHQDGNGDGTVDVNDIEAMETNFGRSHSTSNPSFSNNGSILLKLQLISSVPNPSSNSITNTYDLFVESLLGTAIVTHGIACSINFDDLLIENINVDYSNSSLTPDQTLDIFDEDANVLHTAITRTDNVNQTCDGAIMRLIVIVEDAQTGDPYEMRVQSGNMMSGNGNPSSVAGTTLYGEFTGGASIAANLSASVTTIDEQCNSLGTASVEVAGGVSPYNYLWNTGATTSQLTDLISSNYNVIVTDGINNSVNIPIQINGQMSIYNNDGDLLCGSDCPEYLNPIGGISNGIYKATNTLNSNATILPGSTVEYKAGENIKLEAGTSIPANVNFKASIEDCD